MENSVLSMRSTNANDILPVLEGAKSAEGRLPLNKMKSMHALNFRLATDSNDKLLESNRTTMNDTFRMNKRVSFGGKSLDMSTVLENDSSISELKPNLQANLIKTNESKRVQGQRFEDYYKNKRSNERVANHEGIKKFML